MNVSEIAYAAAQLMSERGHCKGTLWDDEGRVCFNGAILQAYLRTPVDPPLLEERVCTLRLGWSDPLETISVAAEDILAERGWRNRLGWSDPVAYNNDPATSKEDVVMLLKECGERTCER